MFDIFLGIFLFLSPILNLLCNAKWLNGKILALQFYQFKSLSFDTDIIQGQFFIYGVIFLFIVSLSQKAVRNFKDKYISIFLFLCVFSIFLHPKSLSSFYMFFLGVLFYYLVVKYTKNVKRLFYSILAVSTLNTLFALLQFFKIYFLYHPPVDGNQIIFGRYDGLMMMSNHLGAYQALALPICYSIHPFFSIIPLVGLLLSKSFAAIFAGILSMIYLLYPKKEKFLSVLGMCELMSVISIFIIFVIRNYHFLIYKISLRIGIWSYVLTEIFKNSLLGFGVGAFSAFSYQFKAKWGWWEFAYNEYLEIWFCFGMVGLFIMLMFLKDKFKEVKFGIERTIAASCLTVLIICFVQPILHFPRLIGTIIPMFAFLGILKERQISYED